MDKEKHFKLLSRLFFILGFIAFLIAFTQEGVQCQIGLLACMICFCFNVVYSNRVLIYKYVKRS